MCIHAAASMDNSKSYRIWVGNAHSNKSCNPKACSKHTLVNRLIIDVAIFFINMLSASFDIGFWERKKHI